MTESGEAGVNGLRLTEDKYVGDVSGPGVEPSCLDAASEAGAEIGGDTIDASVVSNTVVGTPTTGPTLGGKMFVVTLSLLSELESISIDDGLGGATTEEEKITSL